MLRALCLAMILLGVPLREASADGPPDLGANAALKYWQAFDLQARFVMDRFVDHQYGEVYTAVFQDGKIDSEKVGPWKAPYHVTRACLEIISRLGGTL